MFEYMFNRVKYTSVVFVMTTDDAVTLVNFAVLASVAFYPAAEYC